jgi:TonB family protein
MRSQESRSSHVMGRINICGALFILCGLMAKKALMICLAFVAATAIADDTPASIALLVNEANVEAIALRVAPALGAKDGATRAAAARVALVRGVTGVLPQLRTTLATETDPDAAREEVRALVVLGDAADVDRARDATRKLPPAIDDVIVRAVSRRTDAFEIYATNLRDHGYVPDAAFFTQALWRRPAAAVAAGSRLLGMRDAAGWRALLQATRESHLAMQAGVLGASLNMPVEDIRTASVWYLVRSYVPDPTLIHENVRAALAAPTEEASTREAFGRVLLRRMLGAERKDDPRWLEWLQNAEADPLLGNDEALFQYFTDKEFQVRKNHCGIASYDCRMPVSRGGGKKFPSTAVAQPAYFLPNVLPPGLANAVVTQAGCNGWWLALAAATSDISGRVQSVDVKRIQIDTACDKAITTLMRLSLATPSSIDAPLKSENIVLVNARNHPPCLNESPLGAATTSSVFRVGGEVSAPIVKHRVDPQFPEAARRKMSAGSSVVIAAAIVTREGCVRAVNLLSQSPFPELNGAALEALSQWTFEPARLHGEPVDVEFSLTINFRAGG